jgi:hypothetical protein
MKNGRATGKIAPGGVMACWSVECSGLQRIGKVQIAYFFDGMADLIAQKLGDLRAKCDVVKNKTTDVMFFVMLDYEKAFVGYWILDMDVPQNSNFPSCRLVALFSGSSPDGRPVRHATATHERMSAKLHQSPDSKVSTINYRKPLNRLFR